MPTFLLSFLNLYQEKIRMEPTQAPGIVLPIPFGHIVFTTHFLLSTKNDQLFSERCILLIVCIWLSCWLSTDTSCLVRCHVINSRTKCRFCWIRAREGTRTPMSVKFPPIFFHFVRMYSLIGCVLLLHILGVFSSYQN